MNSIDFAHPTNGAVLDRELLRSTLDCIQGIKEGKTTCMQIQLENKGGYIPVLTVRANPHMPRHPEASVRFYNGYEGFEVSEIDIITYIETQSQLSVRRLGKEFPGILQEFRKCTTVGTQRIKFLSRVGLQGLVR